jgi:hypothetical protein
MRRPRGRVYVFRAMPFSASTEKSGTCPRSFFQGLNCFVRNVGQWVRERPWTTKRPSTSPISPVAIEPCTVFQLRRTIFASSGTVKYSLDADPFSPSCLVIIASHRNAQTSCSGRASSVNWLAASAAREQSGCQKESPGHIAILGSVHVQIWHAHLSRSFPPFRLCCRRCEVGP